MARLQGWESRLNAVLEDARGRPYALGEHDCFRLACAVVQALTGVDRWPAFAGYATRREALLKIAQFGSSFEKAGDWFFGARVDIPYARRGDIAAVMSPDGEKHLAVVTGKNMTVMTPAGLQEIPLKSALCAWKVG